MGVLGKKGRTGIDPNKKRKTFWSPNMQEMFISAIDTNDGLKGAKAKDIHNYLVQVYLDLSLKSVQDVTPQNLVKI